MESKTPLLSRISFYLICGIVVFTTLAYGTVHQPVIAFFYLAVGTLVLMWAGEGFVTGQARISTSILQLPLLLLGIYALVQIIPFGSSTGSVSGLAYPRTISLEPFSTQVTAIHIFVLSAFLAMVLAYIDSERRLRRFVTILTAFGFIYAFFAILQSVLSPGRIYGIYEPMLGTPFGSFVNRHNFAAIIEMVIFLPLAMVFTGAVDRDKRLLYWVAIALMATALLLSGSRGGLMALVGGLIFLAFLTIRQKSRGQAAASFGLVAAIVVLALAGAVFVGGDTSLTRFSEEAATADISANRTHIWSTTIRIIWEYAPLGAGLGAYGQAYTQFDTSGGFQRVDQAHNDYLQVLADAGIVGLVLGGLFLYWLFRDGFRNVRSLNGYRRGVAIGAFAGCFAVLVHSLFDFVLHITAISVMFLSLIGILVASGRRFDDDPVPEQARRKREPASVTELPTPRGAEVRSGNRIGGRRGSEPI
jgi:O-antigen ligase